MKTSDEILEGHEGRKGQHQGWHGTEILSDATPMVDTGTGKALILRTFEFAVKPGMIVPSKQDLFNSHWGYIKSLIWSDGLVANTDVDPRVVIGKKRYRIFILCEPKFRTMIVERPTTLQDIFKRA